MTTKVNIAGQPDIVQPLSWRDALKTSVAGRTVANRDVLPMAGWRKWQATAADLLFCLLGAPLIGHGAAS
jgi:hypothetical protein